MRALNVAGLVLTTLLVAGCVTEGEAAMTRSKPALTQAAAINVQLGFQHLNEGRRADAVLKFERAIEQDPDNPAAYLGLAMVNEQVGDQREARRRYAQAAKVGHDDPVTRNAYGAFLCRQGEHAAAEAEFVASSQMLRNQAPEEALANAGVCMRRAKQMEKSEQYLRSALQLRPDYGPALFELADLSFQRGDALRSRAFLQRLLEANRPNSRVLLLAHRTELALGDARAAQRYAEQLRRDFPESDEVKELAKK